MEGEVSEVMLRRGWNERRKFEAKKIRGRSWLLGLSMLFIFQHNRKPQCQTIVLLCVLETESRRRNFPLYGGYVNSLKELTQKQIPYTTTTTI